MERGSRRLHSSGQILLLVGILIWAALYPSGRCLAGELGGVEAGRNLSQPVFAELAPLGFSRLIEKMQDKRVILLGDASHGTEEYYAFRKQVTRELIRRQRVKALILEAEWDSAKTVDAYIRGLLPADTDPREMLAAAFFRWPEWVWANEEMVEFVLWLKDYNSRLEPRQMVRCHGMDMQLAVAAALDALAPQWPEESVPGTIYHRLNQWWQPYRDDPFQLNLAYANGSETGSLLASELLFALPERGAEVETLLAILVAAEQYYRTMSYDYHGAWNVRSRHFSWVVQQVLGLSGPDDGVVVWAHNSHLGDMSASDVGDTGMINTGQLLRTALGREQVFILGSAGYAGTVLAAPAWGEPVREMKVPPAEPGSFEAILAAGPWGHPLLLWEDAEQAARWAAVTLRHRGIGVVYNPEEESPDSYLRSRISGRYDAVVFWKQTRALRPLQGR